MVSSKKKSAKKIIVKKKKETAYKSNVKPLELELRNRPLRSLTESALNKYFKDLNGHQPSNLYSLFLGEVESPLLA